MIQDGGNLRRLAKTVRRESEERSGEDSTLREGINQILSEEITCATEEELGKACLRVAEELTQSRMSFIAELNAKGLLVILAMSDLSWEACRMHTERDQSSVEPEGSDLKGIYGQVILEGKPLFTNDLPSRPNSVGLPDGHPPLQSFLGVPLISYGRVIGMIGLGNRKGGYRPNDLQVLETLTNVLVQLLVRRRTEAALLSHQRELEELVAKRSEELEAARSLTYEVLASMGDAFMAVDRGFKYVYFNEAAENMFGVSREDMIGQKLGSVKKELNSTTTQVFHQVMQERAAQHYEAFSTLADRWVRGSVYPFQDGVSAFYQDITKTKQIEKEMARLARLNLVGEMAASIGHEIRNPMTTIRGFLQMLCEREDVDRYREYYDLMIEEMDRANAIISDYLNLARDKAVDLKPGYLNSIVKALHPMLQADASYTDKRIMLDFGLPPKLFLDEKEIRQLVMNLARNGLEAMPAGGTLTIGTRSEKDEAILFVRDEGSGISPELLEKLGTPFVTTKDNGTGLGLAVCYSIAVRHNAAVEVATSSEGTTFSVRFKGKAKAENLEEPAKEL